MTWSRLKGMKQARNPCLWSLTSLLITCCPQPQSWMQGLSPGLLPTLTGTPGPELTLTKVRTFRIRVHGGQNLRIVRNVRIMSQIVRIYRIFIPEKHYFFQFWLTKSKFLHDNLKSLFKMKFKLLSPFLIILCWLLFQWKLKIYSFIFREYVPGVFIRENIPKVHGVPQKKTLK